MKHLIFRLLISFVCFFTAFQASFARETTFVSLSPAVTEIFYAIGAQNQLLGVSTECDYPLDVKKKEKVGNAFYVNKEKLLKLSPDYLVTVDGFQYQNSKNLNIEIKTVCFQMDSVNSVYNAILSLGKLSGKQSQATKLVKDIDNQILNLKPHKQKRILYLIQLNPMITVGKKSFLADVIRKSGQINVTDNIDAFYLSVSNEYLITTKPDIIVICYKSNAEKLKQMFPYTKIIYLTEEQNSIINRPGPNIFKAVKYFSEL